MSESNETDVTVEPSSATVLEASTSDATPTSSIISTRVRNRIRRMRTRKPSSSTDNEDQGEEEAKTSSTYSKSKSKGGTSALAPAEDITTIQSMWEVAYIFKFCLIFKKLIPDLPSFDIEELEAAFLNETTSNNNNNTKVKNDDVGASGANIYSRNYSMKHKTTLSLLQLLNIALLQSLGTKPTKATFFKQLQNVINKHYDEFDLLMYLFNITGDDEDEDDNDEEASNSSSSSSGSGSGSGSDSESDRSGEEEEEDSNEENDDDDDGDEGRRRKQRKRGSRRKRKSKDSLNYFDSYAEIPASIKVKIMRTLVDIVLMSDTIRDHVKHKDTDLNALRWEPFGTDSKGRAYYCLDESFQACASARVYRQTPLKNRKTNNNNKKKKQKQKKSKTTKKRQREEDEDDEAEEEEEANTTRNTYESNNGGWEILCFTREELESLAITLSSSGNKKDKPLADWIRDTALPALEKAAQRREMSARLRERRFKAEAISMQNIISYEGRGTRSTRSRATYNYAEVDKQLDRMLNSDDAIVWKYE